MRSLSKLTLILCCVWSFTLLYGEMVAFWHPLWACSWPSTIGSTTYDNGRMKVAVLADPQLTDRMSHGLPPKSLALEAIQFYTDLYMRRSFQESILPFNPDLILFLGDQFDGGPFLSDEEWQQSLSRFRHIFNLNQQGRTSEIKVCYLAGNHDIGYAGVHSLRPTVISRYEKEFGSRNYRFTVGKVEFIAVDAQTLDGSSKKNLTLAAWDFVKNASVDGMLNPRVLLTHIPLYRPNGTPCGPFRSSSIINQRVSRAPADQGIMYQNYLTEETSDRLLELIRPVLVLSGHDHDQCTVTHQTPFGPVKEQTVGTLSWQQGNLHPSFMLLSASVMASSNTSHPEDLISTHLCFLPKQTYIYIWYLTLFVITVLLLLFWPPNGLSGFQQYKHFMEFMGKAITSNFKTGSKEKDDDNCEYEMIWDAEGTMHLVKKAVKEVERTNDLGLTGRGNAVVRPSARKYSAQETEMSFSVEMNVEVKSDDTRKAGQHSKSPSRMVVQRLSRMSRLLMTVAAVNVPLYMMLLFKDWTD